MCTTLSPPLEESPPSPPQPARKAQKTRSRAALNLTRGYPCSAQAEPRVRTEGRATRAQGGLVLRPVEEIDPDSLVAFVLERTGHFGAERLLAVGLQLVEVREVVDAGDHTVRAARRREARAELPGDRALRFLARVA